MNNTPSTDTTTDNSAPLAQPLLADSTDTPTSISKMVSSSFCLAVGIAALPMLLFGINTGILNAPESVIFPGHSTLSWSLAVSAFCVGGFLGSANTGRLADERGRKWGIVVCLALNGIAGGLHVIAPNMFVLILARIGVGIAGGAATCLTPMYLSEVAPPEIKGSIGTLTQLSCVLGILVSILYALPFCTKELWRIIFVPLPLVSFGGVAAGYLYLPESPRWLLLHHYNTRGNEARAIIRKFRNYSEGEEDQEAVEMEVMLMTTGRSTEQHQQQSQQEEADETEEEGGPRRRRTAAPQSESAAHEEDISFKEFAMDPSNRIPLVSSILFPIAQQLSGINAVFYYSTLFFDGVISNPKVGTIVAFAVNVVATLVALALMDKLGRKTLLSWSAGGMGVCCVFMTLALLGVLPPVLTVLIVLVYISFFELGLGCIPFFLSSELIPPQFLGTVQSISMASNWFSNFCVGLFFPTMNNVLGAYCFVPFGLCLLGTVWYALTILPETRGKSLEMVQEELRARRPQPLAQEEPIDNSALSPDAELL